jgi:hypothetical protein
MTTTTTMFSEANFVSEVINEYHRRCENGVYDDIIDIIEALIVTYPDYPQYFRVHYPNINNTDNMKSHLYYNISDILDDDYESGADTDDENEND